MTRRGKTGQALPEFALVAPLFFLLVFGVIQLGLLFGGQVGLTNAAREVARYTSVLPAGQTQVAIQTQADKVLQRSIPAFNIGERTVNVAYCWYTNPTNPVTYSQKVVITIRYGHTLFVPLVGALIDQIDGVPDNRLTVTAREEMKVEAPPLKTQPSEAPCGANP